MELDEIRKTVSSWEKGAEGGLYLQQVVAIVQTRLLLMIAEKLGDIGADLSYLAQDSWNDHHNR